MIVDTSDTTVAMGLCYFHKEKCNPLIDLGLRELTLMMIIFNYGAQTLQGGGGQKYQIGFKSAYKRN